MFQAIYIFLFLTGRLLTWARCSPGPVVPCGQISQILVQRAYDGSVRAIMQKKDQTKVFVGFPWVSRSKVRHAPKCNFFSARSPSWRLQTARKPLAVRPVPAKVAVIPTQGRLCV